MRTILAVLFLVTSTLSWMAADRDVRWDVIGEFQTMAREIQERTDTEITFAQLVRGLKTDDPAAKRQMGFYHLFGNRFYPESLRKRIESYAGPADSLEGYRFLEESMDRGDYAGSWWYWRRRGLPDGDSTIALIAKGDAGLASHWAERMARQPCGAWSSMIDRMDSTMDSLRAMPLGDDPGDPVVDYFGLIRDNLTSLREYRQDHCG